MIFFEKIYFLISGSNDWNECYDYYHHFFDEFGIGAFVWGFIVALIVGILVAIVFYFCLCNSKKSSKYATISVWAISLVVAAVVGYLCADLVKMRPQDDNGIFNHFVYGCSFCCANEKYFDDNTRGMDDQARFEELRDQKYEIRDALKTPLKGVRFNYDITTAVLTVLFFFITSLIVKRFTINGRTIPFLKP